MCSRSRLVPAHKNGNSQISFLRKIFLLDQGHGPHHCCHHLGHHRHHHHNHHHHHHLSDCIAPFWPRGQDGLASVLSFFCLFTLIMRRRSFIFMQLIQLALGGFSDAFNNSDCLSSRPDFYDFSSFSSRTYCIIEFAPFCRRCLQ